VFWAVTPLKRENKKLKADYGALKADYGALKADYTALKDKCEKTSDGLKKDFAMFQSQTALAVTRLKVCS